MPALLALALLAPGALSAQQSHPLDADLTDYVMTLDPEARIEADGPFISHEDAVCTLLASGRGFHVTDPDDARQMAFDPGLAETPAVARPEGVDICTWVALTERASQEDLAIIVSFDRVIDGAPRLPILPPFITGEMSVTRLGLEEGATPQEIGPRYAALSLLVTEASADAAKARANAVWASADAARAGADAAEAKTEASKALLEDLRELTGD